MESNNLTEKWLPISIAAVAVAVPILYFLTKKSRKVVLDPNRYLPFTLREKIPVTTGVQCPVNLYRFNLPSEDDVLGLPVGQHLSLLANIDGKEVKRSYTPTSSNDDKGYFDLVVKVYPQGKMSQHLDSLKPGDSILIKGPSGRFVYKKNQFKKLGMIAGGTGLTPMLQIIREVLKQPDDRTQLSFVFANVTESDIIYKAELDKLAAEHDNFHVYYVLNDPPEGWNGGVGFVTADMIKEHMPAPGSDMKVLMCGPPPMMKAMKGNLSELEYEKSMYFTF